jgi:hypothetical protein
MGDGLLHHRLIRLEELVITETSSGRLMHSDWWEKAHFGRTSPEPIGVLEFSGWPTEGSEKYSLFIFNKISDICTVKSAKPFDTTGAG